MKHSLRILTCVAVFCLSGCASSYSSTDELQPIQTFDAVQYDAERASVEYRPTVRKENFLIGDKATVTVNGFEEFSGVYTIGKDGNIFLGHIGNVRIAGKSIPEVQKELRVRYNDCCLVNPNISIEREGQVFGRIIVDGAVNDAGVFDVDEIITLSEAIALAGGISEIANPEMTILSREINGERKVSNINLTEIRQFGGNDPLIYPSDVVFVQDSKGKILYEDFVRTIPLISAVILGITR